MTTVFVCVYASLAVLIIISALRAKAKRRDEANAVRLRPLVLVVGLADLVLFAAFTFLASAAASAAAWVFFAFSTVGAYLVASYLNCSVCRDGDGFRVTDVFTVTRAYSISDVTAVECLPDGGAIVHVGRRSIRLDRITVGSEEFIGSLEEAGAPFCKKARRGFDPFNGNVADPAGFVVVFVIAAVLAVVLTVGMTVSFVRSRVPDAAELIKSEVRFDGYGQNGSALELFADGEKYFVFRSAKTLAKRDELLRRIGRGETFTVQSDGGNDLYAITGAGGEVFLEYDVMKTAQNSNRRLGVVCVAAIDAMLVFIIGGCLAVGRHPERYGERTKRLFFKKGYLVGDNTREKIGKHKRS